jgi:hypothetical protein
MVHEPAAGQATTLSGPAGDEPSVHVAGGHAKRECAASDDDVPGREVAGPAPEVGWEQPAVTTTSATTAPATAAPARE